MTVFTVHEPPMSPPDRLDRAEAMLFLKDGFTWGAFIFGPLWLLANRLWLAAAGYILVAALGYAIFAAAGVEQSLLGPLLIALNAIVAFEAHWLKSVKLEAGGWQTLGSISGRGLADCERRFFEGWLPTQHVVRRDSAPQSATVEPSKAAAPMTAKASAGARRFAFLSRLRKG